MKISHSALPRTAGITVLWLSSPLFPTKSNRTSNSINKTAASRVEPSHFGLFQTVLQAQACFPNRIFSYFCGQRKREQAMRRLIFGDCPHNWLSTARAARGRNRSFPYETSSFAFHLFSKSICSTSNGFTTSVVCGFFCNSFEDKWATLCWREWLWRARRGCRLALESWNLLDSRKRFLIWLRMSDV